ncbi:hypothetical protein Fmac_032161 [Flemingia macrophylla]|uniref:FAS1 domain-containing protein n=1 Tax=Flemingia macrophylla TaxID=520843 RepID=A0ABD1L443_9FABA
MGLRSSSLLCFAILLAYSSITNGFDVTKILGQYPKFSTLNKYLTETKLAEQINSRNTITILAVDDDGASAIASKSPEAIKAIISTHVVLDYFDSKKLVEAIGSQQQLTTLYQSSGLAVNNQGFIKVSLIGEGAIAFGSAVSGAPTGEAELVGTVMSEPYNISILQVTKFIVAPGIDSKAPSSGSSQGSAKAPAAATPSKDTAAETPSDSVKAPAQNASTPPENAKEPTSSDTAVTPTTAESPMEDATKAPATSPDVAEVKLQESTNYRYGEMHSVEL